MPTYAYTCTECGHAFDIHQSFSDAALTECPNCGGKLRKVFSSVGVVFKGSGFYRTDSRAGSTSGARSSSTPAAAHASGGSTSSEGASSSSGSTSGGTSSTSTGSGSSSTGSTGSTSGSGSAAAKPAAS
ncbi:MAG TPA: FmdB family zinc ribbon protein [Cellulomonas sp.]